jgi:hypothetical protein
MASAHSRGRDLIWTSKNLNTYPEQMLLGATEQQCEFLYPLRPIIFVANMDVSTIYLDTSIHSLVLDTY